MEKGDVFRVADKELMYIAEAVAPSGTVYARRFDLYQGAYGEPEAFQSSLGFTVLFNAFKPEKEEGWEYCEIVHAVDWNNQTEWFEAKAVESNASIDQTPLHHFVRGEPLFAMSDDQNKKTHRKLVDRLVADGWEEVMEHRATWFSLRLKRKKGVAAQKKPRGWNPFRKSST
jgi:hypothetical protein